MELQFQNNLLLDWAILDTFDWLSPVYDNPQTRRSLKEYFLEAGLTDINISQPGALVGKGKIPVSK